MAKIEFSPAALDDLILLKDYINSQWGESSSTKILNKIISDLSRLEYFPLSGTALSKTIGVPTDFYYIFTEKNYVFYRIESDRIFIIRILNERQNYLLHLLDHTVD